MAVAVYWLSVVDLLAWDAGTSVRRCASAAEFVADAAVVVAVAVGAGAGAFERLQPAACAATSAGPGLSVLSAYLGGCDWERSAD